MRSFFIGSDLVLNRIAEPIDVSRKIKQYGESNLYPQIVHAIKLRSPLTTSAVKLLADFYKGDGFSENGDLVLNGQGQSLDDILSRVADDLSEYRGFAVHLNFNAGGAVVEMTPIPFEYCRLGLPNSRGLSDNIKVSNNWESVNFDLNDEGDQENIQTFPKWRAFGTPITEAGAIFYYSDLGEARYPLCSFDPILDNAQSDAEAQLFEVNNLTNGFHSGTIFKHIGPFEDDRAEDRFKEKIDNMLGAKGGNSSMLLVVDEALANQTLVEALPANNNSDLFTQTTINVRNRVIQFFNIPGGLFAIAPEGSVFTVTELGSSFVYMNLRTKNDRKIIERFFNRFVGAGEIKINSFESDQVLNEATPTSEAVTETPPND